MSDNDLVEVDRSDYMDTEPEQPQEQRVGDDNGEPNDDTSKDESKDPDAQSIDAPGGDAQDFDDGTEPVTLEDEQTDTPPAPGAEQPSAAVTAAAAVESVGNFLSERVQRIKELTEEQPDATLDADLIESITTYQKGSQGNLQLLNLFREYSQMVQKVTWIEKKIGLYCKDRAGRDKDTDVAQCLEATAKEYLASNMTAETYANKLVLSVGALDSLVNIVGPDLNESIKKQEKTRLEFDTTRAKVRSLKQKKANNKGADEAKIKAIDAKLTAAEDKQEHLNDRLDTLTHDLREKLAMQNDHRKQKLTEVLTKHSHAHEQYHRESAPLYQKSEFDE